MTEIDRPNFTLYGFAWCGSAEFFNGKLEQLAEMAEPEIWSFCDDSEISILKKYIFKTFERCNMENKILYSKAGSFCCTNTGLLTPKGKDIVMLFAENNHELAQSRWVFEDFVAIQDRDYIETFDGVPELAKYTDNVEELFFNPEYDIEVNYDHIIDDNWGRIKDVIRLPKESAELILIGALEKAKMKAKRNMRLVIPQYYNDKIGFLLPIEIPPIYEGKRSEYLVLAVERTPFAKYRANTIMSVEAAYEKARLLMKIEDNWLRNRD